MRVEESKKAAVTEPGVRYEVRVEESKKAAVTGPGDDSGSGRGWLCDGCNSCAWATGRSLCNAAANDNTDDNGDDDKEM